jgi:hypothetical protein
MHRKTRNKHILFHLRHPSYDESILDLWACNVYQCCHIEVILTNKNIIIPTNETER